MLEFHGRDLAHLQRFQLMHNTAQTSMTFNGWMFLQNGARPEGRTERQTRAYPTF